MAMIFNRDDPFQSLDFERKIIIPYLKEYTNNTFFDRFTGGPDSPIYAKVVSKGDGDEIVYNMRQTFKPNIKIGSEQLFLTGDTLTYGVERLRIGFFRFSTGIELQDLQELRHNHRFSPDIKSDLLEKGEYAHTQRIMAQFGLAFCENSRGLPNQEFEYPDLWTKMLNCGIDAPNGGEMIARSRIVCGQDKGLDQATVGAILADGVLNNAADDTLTVDHLFLLADLADKGSRTGVINKENKIKPYMIGKNRFGFQDKRFLFLTSPDCYRKLVRDPRWADQVRRGTIEHEDQPSALFGSAYKGTMEGIMVVTYAGFADYVRPNANGTLYGYSVMLGAGALGLGIGQTPTFRSDDEDFQRLVELAHVEISGAKVLKFPSKSDLNLKGVNPLRVENGLIHSFVRLHA